MIRIFDFIGGCTRKQNKIIADIKYRENDVIEDVCFSVSFGFERCIGVQIFSNNINELQEF